MDIASKRRMIEVLRGIIGSGYDGTQDELIAVLKKKGFPITQSTISRALKKIGAIKVSLNEGGSRYELKPQQSFYTYSGRISNLVLSVKFNEATIVIKTSPGAAMFVAGFIDHYAKDIILGTVAGDDTIFISPASTKKIKVCVQQIEKYISQN